MKPSNPLPYDYEVNLSAGEITMNNLSETAVPLMIYDKTKFEDEKHFSSYAL